MAALIVALDATVLNVSIPTILRELHTSLPSLQWVVTGYSLTFATLLIIGGRLGDLYGARRMFIIGAALFGLGSLLASLATSVPMLVVGEAVIEGVGASLMMPATLGILSSTFEGHERATAFAVWGAIIGASVAFGPLLGGFLTTNYSWRWSFRINVVIAPLAILGAVIFMRRSPRASDRERIDVPGAILVALGMFSLVFGLSEGGVYGWWKPLTDFSAAGVNIWPTSRPVAIAPVALVLAAILITGFVYLERWKERERRDPLFEFGSLRHRGFRYGLMTTSVLSMGQLGFLFVLPVLLQDGKHLSAVECGLWILPSGLFIIFGAQLGGRLTRRIDTTSVVRLGLIFEAVGLGALAYSITPTLTFWTLLPGLVVFGTGVGLASSQLTNVVLFSIENERAGAASGANTTVRQLGSALGIAVVGSLLSTLTINHAVDGIHRAAALSSRVRAQALASVRSGGVNFTPPRGATATDLATLRHVLDQAVTSSARPSLFFGTAVVTVGFLISTRIPKLGAIVGPKRGVTEEVIAEFDAVADANTDLGPVAFNELQNEPLVG
jgi:EmrB/QacA subfamily drug resistance transporter